MSDTIEEAPDRLDIIWGLANIGNEVGLTERQMLYLAAKGVLPIMKIGGKYCASKRGLRKHFSRILGEGGDVS